MLNFAFAVLALAVLFGALLAVLHLREGAAPPPWPFGALHGTIGVGGLALLVLALRGPPRGVEQGVGSFGTIAAVLLALAVLLAIALIAARLRGKRLAGTLIGAHATLAISGFVVLMVYVLSS